MKIGDWLKQATEQLDSAGIGTARLDALVLAEDATGNDRTYLLAHPELKLTSVLVDELASKIRRRIAHEPLAYIRGRTEFYGREFFVDKRVLEPRPESETMIDLLKQIVEQRAKSKEQSIVDIGTGSGALAVTAKLEVPDAVVEAIDIDPKCIQVAKQNVKKHKVDIKFYQGNLLEPLSTLPPIPYTLLCNLPYVPDNFTINPAAMREPKTAIFGGADGLDLYRQLFKQIKDLKLKVHYVLTESMPPQHAQLGEIAEKHDFKQIKEEDFIQIFRAKSKGTRAK